MEGAHTIELENPLSADSFARPVRTRSSALLVELHPLTLRSERARPLARELRARASAGLPSTNGGDIARRRVHPHVNRLLRSSHRRAQELVPSDLLRRHDGSLHARDRATAP